MNGIWTALGGIVAGVALMWSVFSFIINKRDENIKTERDNFYKNFYGFEGRVEKTIEGLRNKIESQSFTIEQLKAQLELQKEKYSRMVTEFEKYVVKVDRVLENQNTKLENLGKVIALD